MSQSSAINRHERLKKSAEVLTLIDNCRRATGDQRLGAAIERLIIERELNELDQQSATDTPASVVSVGREVVIPVRRIVDTR
jgi:hypothetical protein